VCVCVHALACRNEVWLSNKETSLKKYFINEMAQLHITLFKAISTGSHTLRLP